MSYDKHSIISFSSRSTPGGRMNGVITSLVAFFSYYLLMSVRKTEGGDRDATTDNAITSSRH